jgi:hypothetical protein
MKSSTLVASTTCLLASGSVLATPLRSNCHAFYLDVPVTTPSWTLNIPRVDNDIDAVNFGLNLDRWSAPNATQLLLSSKDVTATYTTYAELCFPSGGKDKKAIQILTHGAFFDHRYCAYIRADNSTSITSLFTDENDQGTQHSTQISTRTSKRPQTPGTPYSTTIA